MSEKNISGITKIAVKGFKSIAKEREIDIRPLTILAGANSSGKSSIMQPLLMLKQTLEAPYDPGPLLLDGPNVQFTEASQFLSTLLDEKGADRFQIWIETRASDFSYSVGITFRKEQNGIGIAEMTSKSTVANQLSTYERVTLHPKMSSEEIRALGIQGPIGEDFDDVKRSRCFLGLGSQDINGFYSVTYKLASDISGTMHLARLRGSPERTYTLAYPHPWYPGTFENYVANLIHEWQQTRDERLKTLTDALYTLGLTRRISAKRIGDISIQLQVGRLLHDGVGETDMVSIADMGFGVSQVLPVLVAVIAAEPGRLVYIEQPELHLHPRAQVALARVLADAAKRGVRVVAETHSSLLLLGVQTLVAEGDLSPELVKLHWFSRDKNGVTEVSSVDLDEAGAYGDWPMDFDDVDLTIQSRYLDAVDRIKFGKEETS